MSMNKSRFYTGFAIFGAAILAWTFFISPFAEQARFENKLQNELNRVGLPSNMSLKQKNDYGDVILGSKSDWGTQYVYSFTGGYVTTSRNIEKAFKQAGYTTTVSGNPPHVIATNNQVGIQAKINNANSGTLITISMEAIK